MDKDKPARAAHTRLVTEKEEGVYRFIIDFEGKELNAIPAETGLASDITVEGDAFLIERQLLKNPATTGWRLSFKIAVPVEKLKSIVPDRKPIVKLTAFLKKGENIPEPLTEIWTYDFRP
jgi:glucans biosynthesis protein